MANHANVINCKKPFDEEIQEFIDGEVLDPVLDKYPTVKSWMDHRGNSDRLQI